jgi:hypothetical protein
MRASGFQTSFAKPGLSPIGRLVVARFVAGSAAPDAASPYPAPPNPGIVAPVGLSGGAMDTMLIAARLVHFAGWREVSGTQY